MNATPASTPAPAGGDSWNIYRRLLGYARPFVPQFAVGVCGMLLFAGTESALAWLVQSFLKGAFVKPNPRILWMIPAGVVVLFTIRGVGDYVANYYPGWVGRQVVKRLRQEVFSHYLRLPCAYLDGQQSGHLLSKLTYNIELVAAAATNAAISMIRDSLTILGLLITIFVMNWRLAAFSLLAAPAIAWLMQTANRSFRRYSARIQSSMGEVTRVAKESIDAQRLIKIFNAEEHQSARFEEVNERNRFQNMK
ncbi:MAG: lipid ABC transporter permease/ATP-binding protein, partial [Proteobacteria bacterium]|nr:lipid ABC transporter permease/ATP-binding protein [Pseudomonadota bacterium]